MIGALMGAVAPVLFVLTFTVDGALRAGYDPWSMFVSELSIGPVGWVQRVNFGICGTLIMIYAGSVSRAVRSGRGAWAASTALALVGAGLALSGAFVTDPSAISDQRTPQGIVHGILGAIAFTCMPISCFVFARRLRGSASSRTFRRWSLTVGIALVVLIVLVRVSQQPTSPLWPWKGLVQRHLIILFMAWLLTSAVRLLRGRSSAPPDRITRSG